MSERDGKQRAVRILARSIYKDLVAQGYDETQIVGLATQLISEVTTGMSTSVARESGTAAIAAR